MKTTAYLRISTDKQDEASQRQIIGNKIGAEGVEWVSDTASGAKPWQDRAIAGVLERSARGDRIMVSEISRIARSTVGVLTFLQSAAEKGVTVDAVKSGILLDGSTASKIVVTVLAMAAEIERDLLRERTKAALDSRKSSCEHGTKEGKHCALCGDVAKGRAVGRQKGATGKKKKLDGRMGEIQPLLDAKVSNTAIARVLKVSRQTLYTFIEAQK